MSRLLRGPEQLRPSRNRKAARLRVGLLVLLSVGWIVAGPAAHASLTPQNQCPGDCSPCLGEDDPFCPTGSGSEGPAGGGTTCQTCVIELRSDGTVVGPECQAAKPGDSGKSSCKVTTSGDTITCKTEGTPCTVTQ